MLLRRGSEEAVTAWHLRSRVTASLSLLRALRGLLRPTSILTGQRLEHCRETITDFASIGGSRLMRRPRKTRPPAPKSADRITYKTDPDGALHVRGK